MANGIKVINVPGAQGAQGAQGVQGERRCDSCHASESEIMFRGHVVFDEIGVCAQACGCVPQHLSLQEHYDALTRWRVADAITAIGADSPAE